MAQAQCTYTVTTLCYDIYGAVYKLYMRIQSMRETESEGKTQEKRNRLMERCAEARLEVRGDLRIRSYANANIDVFLGELLRDSN